jgi:hypothetical protein
MTPRLTPEGYATALTLLDILADAESAGLPEQVRADLDEAVHRSGDIARELRAARAAILAACSIADTSHPMWEVLFAWDARGAAVDALIAGLAEVAP